MWRNITGKIKKYYKFLFDVFLNTLAFGINIFGQQIILMPILARVLNESTYATFLIYVAILNLICNSMGSQLGITKQVDQKKQDRENDYYLIMILLSIFIFIVSSICLYILKYNIKDILILTSIILMSNHRFYIRYIFRIENNYKKVIIQNLIYMAGLIVGLILFYFKVIFWLPMLIGEILAFLYDVKQTKKKSIKIKDSRKIKIKSIIKRFSGYSIATLLSNACNLIDKMLISPLLGQFNLIIYNVGSTMSKILSLITNPVNDVVLAWISKPNQNSKKIILKIISFSIILVIIFSVFTIPLIYIATRILYPQYLNDVVNIMTYLSISGAIGFTASLMKSFVVRYSKSIKLVNIYVIHIVLFTIFGYFGSKIYSLPGFIISTIFSRLQLWICFLIILYKTAKKRRINK